jgi:hypothetical protein
VTSVVFHILSLIIVFGFQIVFSFIVLLKGTCLIDLDSCKSDLIFLLYVSMVSMGIVSLFMCLVYFVSIQIGVINKVAKITTSLRTGFANPNYLN